MYHCTTCNFTCRKKHYYHNHIEKCNYCIKPTFYLLNPERLKDHQENIINIGQGVNNISHDFHELIFHILFYFVDMSKELIKSKQIVFRINEKMMRWTLDIIKMICDDLGIKIIYTKSRIARFPRSIGYRPKEFRYLRDIKKYKNYKYYLEYLNKLALNKLNPRLLLSDNNINDESHNNKSIRQFKVLYTRQDSDKRRLLDYDKIIEHFDEIITNMDVDTFTQIKLFQNISHMVTIGGAALTNIVFMKKEAKVLDIYVNSIKSWCPRYGLDKIVNKYQLVKANKIKINHNLKINKFDDINSNHDIMIDKELEEEIIKFLK